MADLGGSGARQLIASGYPYEAEYGYSRAVRVGNQIFVSGTTARGDDLRKGPYEQAKSILEIVSAALVEADASLKDVVRTVAYVRTMKHVSAIAKAHAEAFANIRPASTVVEVTSLTPAEALVEIEITAVRGDM